MTAPVTEQQLVVHRSHRDFTQVANGTVRDDRLSFRARGVLIWMLSHADGYRFKSEVLAAAGPEGRDAIRAALKELTAAGYYRAERKRVEHRWVTRVHVYEQPRTVTDGPPVQETGFQASADQASANQASRTEDQEEDQTKPIADAQGLEIGEPEPPNVIAKRICDRFFAWVKKETGHDPPEKWVAVRGIVADALKEGFIEPQIKRALKEIHEQRPRPVSRQTLWHAMQHPGAKNRHAADPDAWLKDGTWL